MHQTPQNAILSGVSITTAVGTTASINFRGFRKGIVYVPASSSLTTITWHASATEGGDFEALYDDATTPSAVTTTVAADRAVPLPKELEGCAYVKGVGDAAETVKLSLIS